MKSDDLLYNVIIGIPVDAKDQTMFQTGYQYREELTEHLVDRGGRWIGSGFGEFSKTAAHHAFDIQVAYQDEKGAEDAVMFAQKWLHDRKYTVSSEKRMQYDGKAYAFWVKFEPFDDLKKGKLTKTAVAKVVGKPLPKIPTRRAKRATK